MLLDIRDLKTYFHTAAGVMRAVDGVSFSIDPVQTLLGGVGVWENHARPLCPAARPADGRGGISGLQRCPPMAEMTDRQQPYENPLHPYTKALLSAAPIPDPDVESHRERIVLRGEVPSPLRPPSGCVFHPHCPIAVAECAQVTPALREVQPSHQVACIRV